MCGSDEELRREAESLLRAHDKVGNYFAAPALEVAARLVAGRQNLSLAGQSLSHYNVISLIGAGGMGEVYLAEDTRLGRKVALKLLPKEFTQDPQRVRRFELEARAVSSLNHPNIVTIYEVAQVDGYHFIATEYIDGQTLRERLCVAQFEVREALDVGAQIASALEAAHEAGIVHRDIKPENVIVRPDGLVKVLDFGLAKLTERQNRSAGSEATAGGRETTTPGMVLGTVSYMSPEQARGLKVDARSDNFSLGVVMYEMVAGRCPSEGPTPSDVLAAILQNEPLPLSEFALNVPAELERIVAKALCKDVEDRYQTSSELSIDLKNLKQGLEVQARLKGIAEHPPARIKRHGRVAALAVAAVFVAAAAVAFFFYRANVGEPIDSVAVLPFVNVSSDPNTEYVSEGISDSVINSLSRLPNLKVKSLNAVLRYKGRQIDPRTVGREQNVRAVLTGRMTQRGDDVTISAELVDASDNRRLWGGQYNRKVSDIFIVQDDIARDITEGLRLRLTGEEKRQLARQYTKNNEAFLLYSLGNYSFRQNTKEAFEKSIEYYTQAIKIDPNYALAYTGLALNYYFMWNRGFWTTKEAEQKLEWAALKALALDNTLAEGHVFLGVSKYTNFDWAGSEKEIKQALELDPNSSSAHMTYFACLSSVGRLDEALEHAKRAADIDPTGQAGSLAHAYFVARQYDKAIELFRKMLDKNPNQPQPHAILGETYLAKGSYPEGVAEIEKAVTLDNAPERWDRQPLLAYAYAVTGRRTRALKILNEQKSLAKQGNISPYNFAIIYTGLGDKDRAFEWLEKGCEQRTPLVYRLKSRPMFDSLRSDQRYADLLRKMNLAP